METENQLRQGSDCVSLIHAHLVFVTTYRRGVFTAQMLHDLRSIFTSVCSDFESQLVEFDGEAGRPFASVDEPPTEDHGRRPRELTGVSSPLIRLKNYPSIQRMVWGKSLWSRSYFAGGCGGAPIGVIKRYVEQQRTPS
jgi:REP-associated tyrosine transposase